MGLVSTGWEDTIRRKLCGWKKEGKRVEYYESGKVEEERNYVDGKLDGNWVSYDEEGKIEDVDIYENGVCVDMCEEGD